MDELEHPDAAERARAALANPNAGELLVSVAEGWELADLGGRHHSGGGSHGSLVAGDSFVPLVTVGLQARGRGGSPRSLPPCSSISAWRCRGRWRRWPVSADERARMVDLQLRRRGIYDERVLAAMADVPRELFLPEELRETAYADAALPIGAGQTMSQPYMVALICEQLALRGDERVLDVGTGSGYQAAVLAELAAEVHTIERIPELAESARASLAAAGYEERVHLHVGDGTLGLPECAPFAAIAVAAATLEAPPALYDQLEPRGHLVVRSAAPAASGSRSSCGRPRGRPCSARFPVARAPGSGSVAVTSRSTRAAPAPVQFHGVDPARDARARARPA